MSFSNFGISELCEADTVPGLEITVSFRRVMMTNLGDGTPSGGGEMEPSTRSTIGELWQHVLHDLTPYPLHNHVMFKVVFRMSFFQETKIQLWPHPAGHFQQCPSAGQVE